VNVASSAPASVTNTATVSGGGETNTANDTASDPTTIQPKSSGTIVSDDFTSGTLNTNVWSFVNPANDGSYSLDGDSLQLNVPAGNNHDVWTNGNNTVGVMQPAANTDFEVEAKFSSVLNKQTPFQQQGILVRQDATNLLRFCMYSDNERTIVFIASILGNTGTIIVSQETRGGPASWMRVKRTGNNWQFSYSFDSIHWTPFTFTQALTVTQVGPYAGNAQFNGAPAPAYTAVVDHFVNRAAPLSVIDRNSYPPPAAAPVINVWYGDNQVFGNIGVPQQWVNILVDASDFDQVTTLTYSLNGGAQQPLWMGENVVRLVAPGDLNVEIDYASLNAGTNSVVITATDTLGRRTTHTVTINYVSGHTWPSSYTADWSKTQSPETIAQVVDGPWVIQSGGVNITETGYDRLIAIGDSKTWQNFVATAEVTLNSLDPYGYAVGIIAGWKGHTTLQYGQPLPDQPRTGHPFPGFGGYAMGLPGPPALMLYQNTTPSPESVIVQDTSGLTLQTGVKYIFKFQTQQNSSGGTTYSFKVWPSGTTEPAGWNLQGNGELSTGSIVLAAHRADVTFGLVTVTGL
jgi:regulation of enolase protein 1 (concanavalin A-like superfamily)